LRQGCFFDEWWKKYLPFSSQSISKNTLFGKVISWSDGTGSKFFTRVRSGQFFIARVELGWVSHFLVLVWVWNISPKNPIFFSFFPFGSNKSLRVRSKSTRVKDASGSFYLGQGGSGPISTRAPILWNNKNIMNFLL